ncbi:MAG: right-handed parallel beta-helix repeat-containing protein [Lewinellaceae bacterium]|nr:right-handed parallel beta-helix repeat-containing protein [Lewinellaceae bacterium]
MRKHAILCLMLLAVVQTSRAQLNGNYTIGGSGASFPTFGTAVAALTTQGISGNVTFRVRPGQYEEQFEINTIPGATTNRRVVFESENSDSSSVRLFTSTATAGSNWVVSLQNVGQITFRHLSFVAPSTGLYGLVFFADNCANLLIEHCAFSGIRTGNINDNTQNMATIAGHCPGFQFRNCLVQGGYRALSFNGPSANSPLLNGVVTGNRFTGAAAQGIRIFYVDNLDISDNLFEDNADQTAFIALDIQESDNPRVLRNTVRKNTGVGINLNNCRSTGNNRGLIANNMIAIGSAATNNTGTGMLLSGVWNADLWYNSLNLFATGPGQHYGIRLDNSSRFCACKTPRFPACPAPSSSAP